MEWDLQFRQGTRVGFSVKNGTKTDLGKSVGFKVEYLWDWEGT